jgi:hypothetical protein
MAKGDGPGQVTTETTTAPAGAGWRFDVVFLVILVAALTLRLHLATTAEYIHDEDNNAIALARTISFKVRSLHLPMRGENHGALPAYFVKIGGMLFGRTPIGYRSVHIFLGLCTVVMLYRVTRQWYGPVAALWAAALLAFNEFYLNVSARATAHVPHLFFVMAAVYAFSSFLRTQRAVYLYLAGLSLGLAFYCKEHSALLLLVFFLTLTLTRNRHWLRRPHPYLACAVFALVVAPDLLWNAKTKQNSVTVRYGDQEALQATYKSHLERIGGLGLSPYPSMFYARRVVRSLYLRITGTELRDETPEYYSMNAALGALLVGAALITLFLSRERTDVRVFLLLMFWGIFLFFTLIKKGNPPGRLDPVSWIWVEVSMLPAIVLAGARLADARGVVRMAAWPAAAAAIVYACVALTSPQ